MGNSLHIVYFIEMKNMHGKTHEKWRGKYKRLSYVSNKNKNSEHSSTKDTTKDMIPKNGKKWKKMKKMKKNEKKIEINFLLEWYAWSWYIYN